MKFIELSLWAPAAAVFAALVLGAGCSRDSKITGHLQSADRYFEKREFEKAKIEYINVLRLQNTNSQALLRLGKIFYEQGEVRQAFPLIARSVTLYPEDIQLREALVTIYSAARTNLWRAQAEAIWRLQPANEIATLTLLRMATTPAELADATNRIAELRQRAGDRAIFHIAQAEVARRRGDLAAAETALRAAIGSEPTSIAANVTLGNLLVLQNRLEEAKPHLIKAAELAPPQGQARLRLAQFYRQAGQLDEAARVLDEIIAEAPEVGAAYVIRAELAMGRKQYDEAIRLVDRALSQNPSNAEALRVRAQILLSQNKPADAVPLLERLAVMQPLSGEVHYQLGLARLLNKNPNRAVESLREAVRLDTNAVSAILLLAELDMARGAATDAATSLAGLVRRYPRLPTAGMLLGRAYRASGRLDEAIAVYNAMRREFPSNAAPVMQLGLSLREKRQLAESRQAFEDCLRIDPDHVAAVEQLVALDVDAGDHGAALQRVQGVLDRNPGSAPAWVLKGAIHVAQRQTQEAEAAFKHALSADPEFQPAFMALARLYVNSGRRTEAIGELGRVVTKDPRNVIALTLLGVLHAETGNVKEAEEAYQKGLKVQPNYLPLLNNLAYLFGEKKGQVDRAYEFASRARQLSPENPVVADTLGWLEYRRGSYAEGLRLLSQAAEKLGGNAEVQYHLGMAHYMMGQETPARLALHQAVRSPLEFPGKNTAREYLAMLEFDDSSEKSAVLRALEKRRIEAPTDLIALNRLAAAYTADGAYAKAREVCEAAIKVNPKAVQAYQQLALLTAQHLNDPTSALELARQARQLAPDDPVVAGALGRAAYAAGDPAWAYSLLQESARNLTNQPQVTYDLARAAYGIGRVTESSNLLARFTGSAGAGTAAAEARRFATLIEIAANPAVPGSPARLAEATKTNPTDLPALYASGRIAEQEGRLEVARDAYEALLGRFPSFLPATRQLALLYGDRLGDDGKAYDLAVKVRTALPGDAAIAACLGRLVCRRGDYRYAVQLLNEAVRVRPDDADSLYYLGLAYQGVNEQARSKVAFQKAVSLAPQAKFVPEAKKLLSRMSGD